jgi:hypothetical protein
MVMPNWHDLPFALPEERAEVAPPQVRIQHKHDLHWQQQPEALTPTQDKGRN